MEQRKMMRVLAVLTVSVLLFASASAHEGPDPAARWVCSPDYLQGHTLKAHIGPDAVLRGRPRFVDDEFGTSLAFRPGMECVVSSNWQDIADRLPDEALTVAAWVSVDEPEEWGGIVGTIEDNGDTERGWLLGYHNNRFSFALASQGADDGNGKLTYLQSTSTWEPGRLYHVCGVYDGKTMQLFVNGRCEASGTEQSGPLRYPSSGPFVLGAYRDENEHHPLRGRLREVRIYSEAARPAWVQAGFEREYRLTALAAAVQADAGTFVVAPYLQLGTRTSMTVMWRTGQPATSTVFYGADDTVPEQIASDELRTIHQVTLSGLKPHTQYFYSVQSKTEDGQVISSDVSTFTTAVDQDTSFAFAVFGDTQKNPTVSKQLAELAWGQRPSFLIHVGDLVDTGTRDTDWTEEFFPGMRPLIDRVPFYPVLGNHERNARNYFDYMALPEPEYYYTFTYGNTQFFMIDSNRNVQPGSEQYEWLEEALGASQATWKIVCHHHPPYSSDENDYGDLWKQSRSTRGDLRVRKLVKLYEEYGVDIVWNGHIHSYERTWPLKEGRAVTRNGTIYMITGGAGGGLEWAGPYRSWFQHTVRHGHHYCMVYVNGPRLDIKAWDLDGYLFDMLSLNKAAD